MARGGVTVPVVSEWDPKGVKQAERDLTGFQRGMNRWTNGVKKSFAGIGIGAGAALAGVGALAFTLGKDGVESALAEQEQLASLDQTLRNIGFGEASGQLADWVDDLQFATGVADDELRPALQRLLTATGDVAKSQDLLSLALDISAGSGKSLETVTTALSKAAGGNFTALSRLGIPLDANVLKSKDLNKATEQLSKRFEGQASTAASTYRGQLNRLNIGYEELTESFGQGFLDSFLGDAAEGIDQTQKMTDEMREMQVQTEILGGSFGDLSKSTLEWLTNFAVGAQAVSTAISVGIPNGVEGFTNEMSQGYNWVSHQLGLTSDSRYEAVTEGYEGTKGKLKNEWEHAFDDQIAGLAKAYAPTPTASTGLRPELASQVPASVVNNFMVTVPPGATLDQIAKEGERLAASSGGRFVQSNGGRYGANGAR